MKKIETISNKIDELQKEILKLNEELCNIKKFESVAILKPETTLKNYNRIKENIKKTIDFDVYENLGTKKLAYEIQQHKEGCYIKIEFEGTENDVKELEKIYRTEKNILKFITIRCDYE